MLILKGGQRFDRHLAALGSIMFAFIVIFHGLLFVSESIPISEYYNGLADECSLFSVPSERAPVKIWLQCLSVTVFGNMQVIPFVLNLGIIPMTYLLVFKMSRNKTAAVLSSLMLLTSEVYTLLGSTAALSSDWVFFLLVGVYLMYKKPILVLPVLLIATAAKGAVILVLPMLFVLCFVSDMDRRKRFQNLSVLGLLVIIVFSVSFAGDSRLIQSHGPLFSPEKFDISLFFQLFRHDFTMWLITPVALVNTFIMGFYFKIGYARFVFGFIVWFFVMCLLLPVFSIYQMYDYRMIPMIVFVMVGFGMLADNPLLRKKPTL